MRIKQLYKRALYSYVKSRVRDERKLPITVRGLCEIRETGSWYSYRKVKEIQESQTVEYGEGKYKLIYSI